MRDPGWIEPARRRLGDSPGRHDPVEVGQALGQAAGIGVIVGEALDHPVRTVAQGNQPGRGQDAHLAKAAADQLAGPAGAPDEVALADEDRADRAGQPLRQAERDGVGRSGQVAGRDALGHHRVEEAGAVDVQRNSPLVGDRGDARGVIRAERLAHRMAVRVLDRDQAGDRLMGVQWVAERLGDLDRIEGPVGPLPEGPNRGADDHGVAGRLVLDDMALRGGDRLLAAGEVSQLGDEVALGAGGHEQAGLLAEQLGRALLEGDHGRVVAEHVVADLGRRHRPAHRVGRPGHGVGAQVDQVHRGRV